jgi:hypothetical protein
MTEELTRHEPNDDLDFEREDLSAKSVFAFLAGLVVMLVLVGFLVAGIYRYLDGQQRAHQAVQNPLLPAPSADTRSLSYGKTEKQIKTIFPEPRLESNERTEINDFRMQEEKILNSYGWVDEKAGLVHIPIERAMQLVAERGLPVLSQNGANTSTPASKGATADNSRRGAQNR